MDADPSSGADGRQDHGRMSAQVWEGTGVVTVVDTAPSSNRTDRQTRLCRSSKQPQSVDTWAS